MNTKQKHLIILITILVIGILLLIGFTFKRIKDGNSTHDDRVSEDIPYEENSEDSSNETASVTEETLSSTDEQYDTEASAYEGVSDEDIQYVDEEDILAALPPQTMPKCEVKIALVDSGISVEAIAEESVLKGFNYITNNDLTDDTFHHGTKSAAIILKYASRVKLVPLVCVGYRNGFLEQADSVTLAKIIRDAVDKYDCNVICVVAGIAEPEDELKEAVEYVKEKGCVVVAPVGNNNEKYPEIEYYPAAYDTVIGVGSLNPHLDGVADFSQRGKAVKLLAPGFMSAPAMSGKDSSEAGTSVSCACVAGAVARILEQAPDITPENLRRLLYETADDVGSLGYDEESGYGAINLEKAMMNMDNNK